MHTRGQLCNQPDNRLTIEQSYITTSNKPKDTTPHTSSNHSSRSPSTFCHV
ncbi:MAG: hypothetical protein HQK68_05365 [Desulfamplus sp.]|nr:hypothetical protein [Desulfamplus sp.]